MCIVTFFVCLSQGITEPILKDDDVKDYLGKAINPVLIQGLTQLCKEKPADPVVSMINILLHVSIHTYVRTYIHSYIRTYVHMYICMYVSIGTYVLYVCIHTYIYT